MARVSGFGVTDVDLLTLDLARVVQESLARVLVSVSDRVTGEAVTAAGSDLSSADGVAFIWQDELDGEVLPYIADIYTGSSVQVAVGLADAFPSDELPGIPAVTNAFTEDYIQVARNRLVGVSDELWEDVRAEIALGIEEGWSNQQLAARIRALAGFTGARSMVIARTESHAASESGAYDQMKFVGYTSDDVDKVWLATEDMRTRPTHNRADNQRVPLDETFRVGRGHLRFPGDPGGPPEEIIQCRCSLEYDVDKEPPSRCGGVLVAATAENPACVLPVSTEDISTLTSAQMSLIFKLFKDLKVPPSATGAKIFKTLIETRAALKAQAPDLDVDKLTNKQLLTVVDKLNTPSKAAKTTYVEKFGAWEQTPAGKKALAAAAKTDNPPSVTHVVAPAVDAPPAVPSVLESVDLPDVTAAPKVSQLTNTGTTLGSHGAQVWVDKTGNRWLFKPQEDFLTDLDVGIAKLQSKGSMTRPGIYKIKLNGQTGSIQSMFDSTEAFPGGSFDPLKLSAADLAAFQKEQIFDWMVSNFDTHSGQWIRLANGALFETDKGQAFKFFGKDKLDWDYVPVSPLGSDKLTYSKIWKAYTSGENVSLLDPTTGEIGAYLDRLMNIKDTELKKLLRPYAKKIHGSDAEKFLAAAVARKNALRADFADFWKRANDERDLHVSTPVDLVDSTPTPVLTPSHTLDPATAPSAPPPAGMIPGKAIGDPTDLIELYANAPLYTKHQLMATGKSESTGTSAEVTTDGTGKMFVQVLDPASGPGPLISVVPGNTMDFLDKLFDWTLVDVPTPASSGGGAGALPGTIAGELSDYKSALAYAGTPGVKEPLVYGKAPHGAFFRIVWNGSSFDIERESVVGNWYPTYSSVTEDVFEMSAIMQKIQWHVAEKDGKPPKVLTPSAPTPAPTAVPTPAPTPGFVSPPTMTTTVIPSPPLDAHVEDLHLPPDIGKSHFGVDDGQEVSGSAIAKSWADYPDGLVVATGEAGGKLHRLVVVDGHLVKQTKVGKSWKSVSLHTDGSGLDGVTWTAHMEKLPKATNTAVGKFILKIVPDNDYPPFVEIDPVSIITANGDISAVTDDDIRLIGIIFDLNEASSGQPSESLWINLQGAKADIIERFGSKYDDFTDLQIVRLFDEHLARTRRESNRNVVENRLVAWLQTPAGRMAVNRRINMPVASKDLDKARIDFGRDSTPHDAQDYKIVETVAEAIDLRAESWAEYGEWTTTQRSALAEYTTGEYRDWNAAIRSGDMGSYKSKILNAQRGMRPSTRPMLLHRGTSFLEFNDPAIRDLASLQPFIGKTYVNRNFNSTSVGGGAAFGYKPVLLEIEAPTGTPMAFVDDISEFKGEDEMLLPAHLKYRIISARKTPEQVVIRVRVIGAV